MDLYRIIKEEIDNIFTNSVYFNKIKMYTEDVFELIPFHDSYRDLYPGYDFENEYEDDYFFESREVAYSHVNHVLSIFDELPNPIPIYRTIRVNKVDDIDYDNLGESWSFERESAINFAKNHALGNVLISGYAKFDNVDWKETVKLYFNFSGGYDGYDENEIRIIDSDDIFNIKVEKI